VDHDQTKQACFHYLIRCAEALKQVIQKIVQHQTPLVSAGSNNQTKAQILTIV